MATGPEKATFVNRASLNPEICINNSFIYIYIYNINNLFWKNLENGKI